VLYDALGRTARREAIGRPRLRLGGACGAAHAVDGGLHAFARRDHVHAVRGANPDGPGIFGARSR